MDAVGHINSLSDAHAVVVADCDAHADGVQPRHYVELEHPFTNAKCIWDAYNFTLRDTDTQSYFVSSSDYYAFTDGGAY